jgi:hypothetical protein
MRSRPFELARRRPLVYLGLVASTTGSAHAQVVGFKGRAGRPLIGLLLALVVVLLVACVRGSETGEGPDDRTSDGGAPGTMVDEEPREDLGSVGGETTLGAEGGEASEGAEGRTTAAPTASFPSYGYTYGMPSGNRVLEGSGDLPGSEPIDVSLSGEPAWVIGASMEGAFIILPRRPFPVRAGPRSRNRAPAIVRAQSAS